MRDKNSNVITVCKDSVLHAPKKHDVDAIYCPSERFTNKKKKIEKIYDERCLFHRKILSLVCVCVRSNCQSI